MGSNYIQEVFDMKSKQLDEIYANQLKGSSAKCNFSIKLKGQSKCKFEKVSQH